MMLGQTVAVSHVTWLLIERPTSRLGVRRGRKRIRGEADGRRLALETGRR
jgi:hypothetical protein